MDIPHLLQRLQADNTSGATTLGELALDILEAFAVQQSASEPHDFSAALQDLVGAVLAAQPSMAVMLNLAQQVLQACPEALPLATARRQLQQTLTAFRHDVRSSTAALCQQALAILPPQSTVLTYANSATVVAALCYAHDRGRVRRVLLSESRPAYDGRLQALALLEHGITVEYSIDMALFERLPEADAVMVGADAVFPDRLINKLGTHALAQLAQLRGVPLYSLCAASKFLPATATALWRIVDHPGEAVWPDAPTGLYISNRYFDATPLTLLRGIVSEQGLYTPETLRLLLQQWELSPLLLRLASGRASSDYEGELAPNRTRLEGLEQR
jgi:translation initiation factor 2B subunit (eIF-2B alpha/beta/delta family)